jgi:hypothetical protein
MIIKIKINKKIIITRMIWIWIRIIIVMNRSSVLVIVSIVSVII